MRNDALATGSALFFLFLATLANEVVKRQRPRRSLAILKLIDPQSLATLIRFIGPRHLFLLAYEVAWWQKRAIAARTALKGQKSNLFKVTRASKWRSFMRP